MFILFALILIAYSQQSFAHVEYYDLNQGKQITDLTSAGKSASTTQYGANPSSSISGLTTGSDRPLQDSRLWNSNYQTYSSVGSFTNRQVSTNPDFSDAIFYLANEVDVDDVTDWGWADGTWGNVSHTSPTGTGLLGDSHKVDFFNFRLEKPATVTITWNIDDTVGNYYDGAFSLYRGVLSYQGHDDATDHSNPKQGIGVNAKKIQDELDTGLVLDSQGIASAYRNTLTNSAAYIGQFNALDNWGDGNTSGNWSNIAFIAAINTHNPVSGFTANPAETLETLVIELQPGNYTIAASGALGAANGAQSQQSSGLHGKLTFKSEYIDSCPVLN